jgi:molybdopterin-guanine dinucleotide biosynthesis protein MobB
MLILSLVGLKKCGKTTTAEALIREFKRRGLLVCAVKFMPNSKFTIDVEGKDTFRQYDAGADVVISLSDGEVATIERVNGRSGLDEALGRVPASMDVVLCEGLSTGDPRVLFIVLAKTSDDLVDTFEVRGRPDRIAAFSGIMASDPITGEEIEGIPVIDATKGDGASRLADIALSSQ